MANTRKTIVTYKGNGTQKVFAFPFDYLRKSFVMVMFDGVGKTYGVDYTVTSKQVEFTTPPANGVVIVIYRETATDRLVAWEDASVLRASDMTLFEVQLLHLAEETQDKVQESGLAKDDYDGIWDARLTRIKNVLDPVDALDALNKRYFESTQAGFIQASQALVNEAINQKNQATTQAQNSASSARAALASQNAAKTSETNAKTSETNAKASENAAKTSETNAKASETNAKTSETNAKASENAAKNSEIAAKVYQDACANYQAQINNQAGFTKAESDARYAFSGFGLGVQMNRVEDANSLTKTGFYYCLANLPIGLNDANIYHHAYSDYWAHQLCFGFGPTYSGTVYVRIKKLDVWQEWKQLASIDVVPKLHCFKFATASQYIASINPVKVNGLEFTVTPRSASSNFLIIAVINGNMTYVSSSLLFRNGSPILSHGDNINEPGSQATTYITNRDDNMLHQTIQYVDAPGTTNPVTYDVRCTSGWEGIPRGLHINNRANGGMATPSTLTIIEF